MLRTTIAAAAAALLFSGCASKEFSDVQQTAALKPLSQKVVDIGYAADTKQRELLQPFVQASLYRHGVSEAAGGHSLVIAPRFIGDYMKYNDAENPIALIEPLAPAQLQEKVAHERDAAAAMSKSLYYRFSEAADFKDVNQWMGNYGLSVASAAVTAYMIDGLVDADGYQMVTDVYVDGKRTRIFAHTFDSSLEPEEAIVELARMTAEKIARIVSGDEGGEA